MRAVVADRFCKQPLANTGAYDEISPPAHGVFKPKRENMLINYRENLPFKSDFIFARARNLKREIDKNSVRILRLISRHVAFARHF